MRTDVIRLPDGRRVSFLDLGDPAGEPVFHSHGAPSGRLETAFFDLDTAARSAGIRLIAPDRPGIGESDPKPGRTLLEWGDDVADLADALAIGQFGLLGYSVGSASALACRSGTPERVTATAVVSGIGPTDVTGLDDGRSPEVARIFRLAVERPRLTSAALTFMRYGTRDPRRMIAASGKGMPAADRLVAARPESAAPFAAFLADALRQGPRGARDDLRLAALPWGFVPGPTTSPLAIWHGTADTNVPVAAAHWLSACVPGSELVSVPGAGHISLLFSDAAAILRRLGDLIRTRSATPA